MSGYLYLPAPTSLPRSCMVRKDALEYPQKTMVLILIENLGYAESTLSGEDGLLKRARIQNILQFFL